MHASNISLLYDRWKEEWQQEEGGERERGGRDGVGSERCVRPDTVQMVVPSAAGVGVPLTRMRSSG